jgi:16S rRNA (guanine966-N2)-methyltransferase
MRIIAGKLGGRQFNSPKSHRTHPMADKVRGALFNTLGDIKGLTVLDAFAGTGALSYEALSRGASSAVVIETDKLAQRTIAENVSLLGLGERIKLIKGSCVGWGRRYRSEQFDLVLVDPPFDDFVQMAAIDKLTRHVRRPDGLYVLNWPGRLEAPVLKDFTLLETKGYGDTQLLFYR